MRYAYPPYDFIIIACLTLVIGFILRKILFKNKRHWHALVPYAIAFLCVSIGFSSITDQLPLKVYPYREYVYDPQTTMGPSPQGPNANAAGFLKVFGLSLLINFLLLGCCVIVILRYFVSLKQKRRQVNAR